MYNVSSEYLNAISQPVRTFKIEARFNYKNAAQAVFDDSSITGEVMIESQAVSGSATSGIIDIGAVPSATASLTIIDNEAGLKKYVGSSFTICVSLLLENSEYEDVPMGTFYCDSAKTSRTGNRISVYGYDAMITFKYTLTDTMRSRLADCTAQKAASILTEFAKCKFDQDLSDFPNSDMMLDFSNTQVVTGWDGIMWIAQLMGCFAHINRQNHLEFVPIKSTWEWDDDEHTSGNVVSVKNITSAERFKTTFSDDRIHITGVSMPDQNNNLMTRSCGGSETDSNVTIMLEKNPLIKSIYGLEGVLNRLLAQLQTTYFYAFQSEIINDPALDVGDTVRLQGGEINGIPNNELVGFITHSIWRYRGRQEIANTGQTTDTITEAGSITQYYSQPTSQSEKLLNSVSGSTNKLKETVSEVDRRTVNGINRARYLKTYDYNSSLFPSAIRSMNTQEVGSYSGTNEGAAGFALSEVRSNRDYGTDIIKGTINYETETGATLHPIKSITCRLRAKPSDKMINGSTDYINMEVSGNSLGNGAFQAQADLGCYGLWVPDSVISGIEPTYVQLFKVNYLNSSTEFKQEFVIANVHFDVKDDGIYITRPHTSLHFVGHKSAFIPWSNEKSSAAEQSGDSAEQVQTKSTKATASANEPLYTYDDDGIHISFNGHTKIIPWDT